MSPLYAGETTRIRSTGTDFNGEPLTDMEVTATVVIVRTADDTEVRSEVPMTYDYDEEAWVYDWNTSAIEAGTFMAKVKYVGASFETWEFKRFRLRRNPI